MLQALGAKFYDDEAQEIDVTQGSRVLKYIRRIDVSQVNPKLKDMRIQLMSDFDSKLYGKIVKLCKHMKITKFRIKKRLR